MTNSLEIAVILRGSCPNTLGGDWHRHIHLIGGSKRTALVAQYPPRMVAAILRAFKKQLVVDGEDISSFSVGPHADGPDLPNLIDEDEELENGDDECIDDVAGGSLDLAMVRVARLEEIKWIEKRQVLDIVDTSER